MRKLDPIDHIRAHPEMYLPGGTVDLRALADRLAGDARILGATGVRQMRAAGWWLVLADQDWLAGSAPDVRGTFTEIVPFPEAGPNSMRTEVLLSAFADEVVTFADGRPDVVKDGGEPSAAEALPWFELPLWFGPLQPRRVVAFRLGRPRPAAAETLLPRPAHAAAPHARHQPIPLAADPGEPHLAAGRR